ncbi:ABC transporter ATP-binding protein/permease [bacterium]|nr:ABC transporter ATP-binding protein/permease [bacterium]
MKESIYIRLFKLIKPYKAQLIGSTIAALFYVAFNSASIWFTASLLNSILGNFKEFLAEHETFRNAASLTINQQIKFWTNDLILRDTAFDTLKVLSILIILVFVLKNFFLYIKNILLTHVQYNFITELRNNIYRKYLSLSLTFFNKQKSGELTSTIITDVSNMRSAFTLGFQRAFVEPLNIIAFIILLFVINIQLALIAILIVPVTGIAITAIGRSIKRKSRRVQAKIANITNVITETLTSMRIVKAFTTENFENNRFQRETSKFYNLVFRRARLRLTAEPLTEIIGVFVAVVLIILGGSKVLVEQSMTSEDFLRFILVLFSALAPIRLLSNVNMEIQTGMASAERVFSTLDSKSDIINRPDAYQLSSFDKSIEFKTVGFTYNTEEDAVLSNISFTINKGKVVALVGESGAGKSTIADLVPRFYDVTNGSILIDGKDLRDVTTKSLRKLMGIVTQETILFNDTIRANIAYGLIDATNDDVVSAAKTANALDFILDQPHGFDTIIGDKGVRLSGGQRQRLAIARAVLNNPPILILDEATSSLDTRSEKLVQEALDRLMNDRTVLVIAHRLSTIQKADKIIVLEKGCITESGTHKELLNKNGQYRRLHDYQFSKLEQR